MSINKQQVLSALVHVIHPVLGKDVISLDMVQDLVILDKYITFTIALTGKNPEIERQLKEHCENTIYTFVDNEAIVDIQTEFNAVKQQEVEEKEVEATMDAGLNPMSMADSTNYMAPTTIDAVPYENMPKILQHFMDEHEDTIKEMNKFERELQRFKSERWVLDEEMAKTFSRFFNYLDSTVLSHNKREEKLLFPLLQKRLLESGEHSSYQQRYMSEQDPRTGVEVMEDEHITFIQFSTLIFNFMGLAGKLPDITSQSIVSDLAYEQSLQLVEMLRLHMLRENGTLFPIACTLISNDEFEEMWQYHQLSTHETVSAP